MGVKGAALAALGDIAEFFGVTLPLPPTPAIDDGVKVGESTLSRFRKLPITSATDSAFTPNDTRIDHSTYLSTCV